MSLELSGGLPKAEIEALIVSADGAIVGAAGEPGKVLAADNAFNSDGTLKTANLPSSVVSGSPTGGVPAWAASTEYKLNQLVTAAGVTFICLKAHTSGKVFSGVGENWAVFNGNPGRLWDPPTSDTVLSATTPGAQATRTVASGQVNWYGGHEMIAKAGRPIGAAKWLNFNASTSLTNQFACLGLPDEKGDPWVTILAVSKDLGAAAWAEKTIKKFSFAEADGGTGIWTPSVDTPVYLGICVIGSGLPTMSGVNIANEEFAKIRAPWFYCHNPKNLTSPAGLVGGTYELETQAVAYCGCAATESSV
jgi:hypothetical protein